MFESCVGEPGIDQSRDCAEKGGGPKNDEKLRDVTHAYGNCT